MKLTRDQKCWVASIGVHVILGRLFSLSIPTHTHTEPSISIPVEVQFVKETIQKKVAAKTLVSKKALPSAKPAKKPTALPGDRIQPAVAKKVAPTYPKKALNNDWEGTVKVKVTVSSTGDPISIKVVSSSGHRILDQAFIRSIKANYRFKPKRSMGKNMAGSIVLSYTFSLKAST